MGKIAFIYPGQGAQCPHMGQEIMESYKEAEEVFDLADSVLDFDLKELCFTDNDAINDTAYTQPALLTVSVAITEVIESYGIKADYTAGLSLGEYTALVASGVMTFKDAVMAVRQRGILMQEAGKETAGAMAAIIGSNKEDIDAVIGQVDGYIAYANFNNPKQIVLSGEKDALAAAYPLFKEAGIKAIPLNVSGAFHSKLMASAAEGLTEVLAPIVIEAPDIPYVTNVTGDMVTGDEEIKALLISQLTGSVLWEACVRTLMAQGVDTFVEIGPGKTLAGLIKKIDRKVKVISVGDQAGIDNLRQYIEENGYVRS